MLDSGDSEFMVVAKNGYLYVTEITKNSYVILRDVFECSINVIALKNSPKHSNITCPVEFVNIGWLVGWWWSVMHILLQ